MTFIDRQNSPLHDSQLIKEKIAPSLPEAEVQLPLSLLVFFLQFVKMQRIYCMLRYFWMTAKQL